jgi:hypothetical protein
LGRASGFVRDDTQASRREKLQALLAHADLADEDVALLLDLMALPMPEGQSPPRLSPPRKTQRILEAQCRHLEALVRQQPVVVSFTRIVARSIWRCDWTMIYCASVESGTIPSG